MFSMLAISRYLISCANPRDSEGIILIKTLRRCRLHNFALNHARTKCCAELSPYDHLTLVVADGADIMGDILISALCLNIEASMVAQLIGKPHVAESPIVHYGIRDTWPSGPIESKGELAKSMDLHSNHNSTVV
jgi:hypothetical protein